MPTSPYWHALCFGWASPMNLRKLRSFGLLVAIASAAMAPFLINCSSPSESEEGESEGALTGVDNKLGLALTYDEQSGSVTATLKESLKPGESLKIRVRRGTPQLDDEAKLDCDAIQTANPITGEGSKEKAPIGKVVYQGPKVEKDLIDLIHVYDDHRWQTDIAWAKTKSDEIAAKGGPKALVEACVMRPGKAAIKLQTNLEQAWDLAAQDEEDVKAGQVSGSSLHFNAGDGGTTRPRAERALESMEQYGQKCVDELGEIPFFKKLGRGKYDTFDCRDFVGTGAGHEPAEMAGVEGSLIPLTKDDQPVTKCDGEGPNGQKPGGGYDCVKKCDKAEFLSEGCEPGPTVTHAKNDKGTHWVLLCRKVAGGEQVGWTKTKKFNDIAMIGNNPKTGKTCFFQNTINSGIDGEHVPHPADRQKSRTMWDGPKGYCFQSCHGTDAFISTPWINSAKRGNSGKPVVPMMGFDPDYEISWLESPYYVINMDPQGWTIPKQLVSDDAGPCISCHRAGGENWIRQFANWTTGNAAGGGEIGNGDSYWDKITNTYKAFEKSHWMPMRLDGINAQNWATSKFGKAVEHLNKCNANSDDPACVWADVPRGPGNPVAPNR
jgi:hypothetical protein